MHQSSYHVEQIVRQSQERMRLRERRFGTLDYYVREERAVWRRRKRPVR
jgi:hypothetical protein